jgi:hypothetical protein
MVTDIKENIKCNFDPMEILNEEIPMVQKMVRDECWYEGEKVHREVLPKEVEITVEKIILESGHKMRDEAIDIIKKEKCVKDCDKCEWRKDE